MGSYYDGILSTELPESRRYDPVYGMTRVRTWKGIITEIAIVEEQALRDKYRYTTGWELPYATISVEFPETQANNPDEPLSDDWSVKKNLIQKSLWELPKIKAEFDKIGPRLAGARPEFSLYPEVRAQWRKDFESLFTANPTTGKRVKIDGSGNPVLTGGQVQYETYTITLDLLINVATLYGANSDVLLQLADSFSRGVTHFDVVQYVLKRTRFVNPGSNIVATKQNVLRMFNAATILSQASDSVKAELPDGGYYLKIPPEVDRSQRSKWKIEEEYWHVDYYEYLIYGDAI